MKISNINFANEIIIANYGNRLCQMYNVPQQTLSVIATIAVGFQFIKHYPCMECVGSLKSLISG